MSRSKIINVRTEEEVKEQFEQACEDNYTDPSAVLYKFIRQYIRQNKGSETLLSNLRNKS